MADAVATALLKVTAETDQARAEIRKLEGTHAQLSKAIQGNKFVSVRRTTS